MTDARWYVESSVVLRAATNQSASARAWFEGVRAKGDLLIASRLMELEVRPVLMNVGHPVSAADPFIDDFLLAPLDDALVDEAIDLDARLCGADALDVATAVRVGVELVTFVTHDRQMAVAASRLGFEVFDPVTDDPGRGPVTEDI